MKKKRKKRVILHTIFFTHVNQRKLFASRPKVWHLYPSLEKHYISKHSLNSFLWNLHKPNIENRITRVYLFPCIQYIISCCMLDGFSCCAAEMGTYTLCRIEAPQIIFRNSSPILAIMQTTKKKHFYGKLFCKSNRRPSLKSFFHFESGQGFDRCGRSVWQNPLKLLTVKLPPVDGMCVNYFVLNSIDQSIPSIPKGFFAVCVLKCILFCCCSLEFGRW